MPLANTLTPDSRFMGLFVAKSGSGKTTAAASFQDEEHNNKLAPGIPTVKIFDFDGRIRGLLGSPWINRERIEYISFPPRVEQGGEPNFVKLNNQLELIQNDCKVGKNHLDTIVLDSLTSTAFAMITDAMPLTHQAATTGGKAKGRAIGNVPLPGMEDYGYEANAIYSIMSFFRSLPIKNIVVTAHIVPTYGKENPEDPFSPTVENGTKLSVRDKVGANVLVYFDHVFEFSKDASGTRHSVRFTSDMARTSFPNMPRNSVDITGQNFYKFMMNKAKGV